MILLKNILKKLGKIIFKHLFICVLIAYTPLPFFDILTFYNQDDPLNFESEDTNAKDSQDEIDNEQKNKWFKLKVLACVCGAIIFIYIIYKINTEMPSTGSGASKNSQISNIFKAQQEQIMQKRMDNALSTTRKILEIKKKV